MNYFSRIPLINITPDDGKQYFFGYYDLQPFDRKGKRHLAHRADFLDHIPEKGENVEVGYITVEDKVFHKVGESNAWNFQQGALLQWFDDNSIIYNDFRDGRFSSVIKSVDNGEERVISSPLACISEDRKWGLSINFSRVYDFRPGYGYCNLPDEFYSENAPAQDGIFLVDLEKNEKKLIVSYKRIKELFPEKPFCDMKLLVNHITFNPSADRFLCLIRNFPEPGKRWGTILVTFDREGKNERKLTDYQVNSHYHWKNDDEIIIYSGLPEWGVYLFNEKTGEREMLDDDLINYDDIHCLYSPDRSCFIGDGYPSTGNFRYMMIYDFETKRSRAILKMYSPPVSTTDIRCDLHNRFSRDGSLVSFDSTHNSRREIMLFSFDKKKIFE